MKGNEQGAAAIRVIKVGGSLFDWPELFPRLGELLARQDRPLLLLAGGGPAADLVRKWDRRHGLGAERAHRLAIRSLRLGEGLLHEGVPGSVAVSDLAATRAAWTKGRQPILNVEEWLRGQREEGHEVPRASWDITSDSIAAFVACRMGAKLLLVKSTTPDDAGGAFVDPVFETFAQGLSVAWLNLRSGERGRYLESREWRIESRTW